MPPDTVVIGAGIAGLTAAHELSKLGYGVIVLEKDQRVGGRIRTEVVDGIPLDVGAGFIANFYENTLQLLKELDLTQFLIPIPGVGAVVRNGHLVQLGAGLGPLTTKSKALLCWTFARVL